MIKLRGVHFSYGASRTAIVDGLDLDVDRGEKLALSGPNGAGKTTILQILNGLLHPRRGTYTFEGHAVTRRTLRQPGFRQTFRSRVVYLFPQSDIMLFNNTVFEEIAFSSRVLGLTDVQTRVERWAEVFDLKRQLSEYPLHLSAGERRRVCLAAIMSLDPEVILLDEPEADIDAATTDTLVDLLRSADRTVVLATHNPELRQRICQREVSVESRCS